jgi:hypothetical protein
MLSLGSSFNYYFCAEPVTLRYRHKGLRHYIKSQLHRDPTNGDIYIFLSKECKRIRLYYYHHQGEILSEKILNASHFVEPVFDAKKGVYHISWESFVYLLEGIVLRDRKVPFSEVEAAAESSITSESEISDEAQNRVFPNSESTQNSVLNNLNY